jgi:hypothetical protein
MNAKSGPLAGSVKDCILICRTLGRACVRGALSVAFAMDPGRAASRMDEEDARSLHSTLSCRCRKARGARPAERAGRGADGSRGFLGCIPTGRRGGQVGEFSGGEPGVIGGGGRGGHESDSAFGRRSDRGVDGGPGQLGRWGRLPTGRTPVDDGSRVTRSPGVLIQAGGSTVHGGHDGAPAGSRGDRRGRRLRTVGPDFGRRLESVRLIAHLLDRVRSPR